MLVFVGLMVLVLVRWCWCVCVCVGDGRVLVLVLVGLVVFGVDGGVGCWLLVVGVGVGGV